MPRNVAEFRIGIDFGFGVVKLVVMKNEDILLEELVTVRGQQLQAVRAAVEKAVKICDGSPVYLGITGITGEIALKFNDQLNVQIINQNQALCAAVEYLYPYTDSVSLVEMGFQSQRYLYLERDQTTRKMLVKDSDPGGKCASGSGSLIEAMAINRLEYKSIDEFVEAAYQSDPVALSGRCPVFCESDIIHSRNKGTPKEKIAAGICRSVATNYIASAAQQRNFSGLALFIGGVSCNSAVKKWLNDLLKKEKKIASEMIVPKHNRTMNALGAALKADKIVYLLDLLTFIEQQLEKPFSYQGHTPIKLELSTITPYQEPKDISKNIKLAGLGVDIGSESTKAALVTIIDKELVILASHYQWTGGNPIAAVRETLVAIQRQVACKGYSIERIYASTTGSGRFLTGDYIGANDVINEITAQASGALSYTDEVDTIIEIGGQDSKCIWLKHGIMVDFEMNKACAAGTGAFLRKQAECLGFNLESFGDIALSNVNPPIVNTNCTVFAELTMSYYQANGVAVEDLAAGICLACAQNYMAKTVGSKKIGQKVAFHGAVSLNKGMVAAFESVLGCEIKVAPYPHLTGAVGAARLAFLNAQLTKAESKFLGFEEIASSQYEVSTFICQSCENKCEVNLCQRGNRKFYYNARCEKYEHRKADKTVDLPDLFAEYNQLLMESYDKQLPKGSPVIGIPRGGMFATYFPLFNAFFGELGFQVVVSDQTNKHIVELGESTTRGEPCFPVKIIHGHHASLAEKNVDIIFSPRIISGEKTIGDFTHAQACPYIQALPDIVLPATQISQKVEKVLSPVIHFVEGWKSVERVFIQMVKGLGIEPMKARRAFGVAKKVLSTFRNRVARRGEEVLANLPEDALAFVIVGRPYGLYDSRLNMDIGKKLRDLGILAIPQDFLPLDKVDVSKPWKPVYSKQLQRKIAAARIIRNDVRLEAIVLTYFACGPDSFGNSFFSQELGGTCYVMQIDAHTADAGVQTRIEAFYETVKHHKQRDIPEAVTKETEMDQLNGRVLWIPRACDSAEVLAAALQAYGVDARALDRCPDASLSYARDYIHEDVCVPMLYTANDMVWRTMQPDFDPDKEAFFMGNANGPCRFGMYYLKLRSVLDQLGYVNTPISTLGVKDSNKNLGLRFKILAWDGLVAHDLLFKMLQRIRPYEINKGQAEKTFRHFIDQLTGLMLAHKEVMESYPLWYTISQNHLKPFKELLRKATTAFLEIPISDEKRPLVGVVGEFFVRLHDGANQQILQRLEDLGAEVWMAPLTEFFGYANIIGGVLAGKRFVDSHHSVKNAKDYLVKTLAGNLSIRDEHEMFKACLPLLKDRDDIDPYKVIKKGSRYINPEFGGEAICSAGKAGDFAERGLDGIVNVIPFGCMPGNIFTAVSTDIKQEYGISVLNLVYDGYPDSRRDEAICEFMAQINEQRLSCGQNSLVNSRSEVFFE